MALEKIISKESLKKTTKIIVPLIVGFGVAYGFNETGITQWMAEKQIWNETLGLELGKDYLVPIGKWVYNSTAGGLATIGTYLTLNNVLK